MENEIKKENKEKPLILEEMMKKFSYYPNNKEFEMKTILLEEKNNFSLLFPNFLKFLRNFDSSLSSYLKKTTEYIKTDIKNYLLMNYKYNDNEIKEYIKFYWVNQGDYNIIHICLFLILADKYIQNFSGKLFSEYDKNILYWTILFHDLGKHMNINPLIKEKINKNINDKTHPFKSIIIFLNIFFEKNLFYYPNENYKNDLMNFYKNEFSNSLFNSWKLEKYKKNKYNISFEYIDIFEKFFNKIKEEEKNEWIYDICILIIFHQSLPNNDGKMNRPLLDEKYIKIFFSKRLIELMRVIMIYDSASHSLFNKGEWTEQINKHIDELLKLFD